MQPRDVAIVAAVLVVAGVAAADALRDSGAPEPSRRPPEPPPPTRPARYTPLPEGGAVAFADARDCRLRIVDLVNGRERRLPPVGTACYLSGSPSAEVVARGTGTGPDSSAEFRLLQLDPAPPRELGGGARVGPIAWSYRGRIAWCESATNGVEYDGEVTSRELAFCPRAYVREQPAWTRDRELVVGGRVVMTASGHIEQVAAGIDGSVALVLEGGRIERRGPRGRTYGIRLPADALATTLVFAPDTCAAAAVGAEAVAVIELGCFRGRRQVTTVSTDNCTNRRELATAECARYPAPRTFVGRAAAWSPDGEWLAVAEPGAIGFHRLVGGYRVVRWPAAAAGLVWLR